MTRENYFILIFYLFIFLACFRVASDPDLWWHLEYGEYIFHNFNIPLKDTYSFSMQGYYWIDSYILPQLLMYLLLRWGGYLFMSFFFNLLLFFSLFYLFRKAFEANLAKLITFALVCVVLSSTGIKPLLISSIFMIFFWYILIFYSSKKMFFTLPLLFFIWSLTHADFIIGLSILAFFAVTSFLNKKDVLSSSLLIFVFIGSLFGTFLNPYSFGLYSTLLNEIFSMSLQGIYIQEWQTSFGVFDFGFLTLLVVKAVFSGFVLYSFFVKSEYIFAEKKVYSILKKKKWFLLPVIGLTLLLTFKSAYFFRLFTIFSSPLLYVFFYELAIHLSKIKFSKIIIYVTKFLYSVTFLLVLLYFVHLLSISNSIKKISYEYSYPYDAVNYIKNNDLQGNMLNEYKWGGYLIYYLPQHKTFIDGRMPAWKTDDKYAFKDYITLYEKSSKEEIEAVINKYSIEWALLPPDSQIAINLQDKLGWEPLYDTDIAVILIP